MKPVSYKRIIAYLLDVIFVTFVGTLLTMFIPMSDKYETASQELMTAVSDYQNKKISDDVYLEKVADVNYTLNRESVAVSIVSIVLSTVYFVVVAYYMNGQTFGKRIMKIKIVSKSDKKLKMNNYLIRSLIIDSLLMNTITVVLILFLTKGAYIKVTDILSSVFGVIYIITFAMMLFRKDGRGLHDMLAGTVVISTMEGPVPEPIESDNDIKEANVIKEVKSIEKETKGKTSNANKTSKNKNSEKKEVKPKAVKEKKVTK